jgi:hypothetical protein
MATARDGGWRSGGFPRQRNPVDSLLDTTPGAARRESTTEDRPSGLSARVLRVLLAGPGQARPGARLAVYVLTAAGAIMLAWCGVIHLRLWADGYSDISVIGPLFLAQGAGSLVITGALVIFRRLVLMLAGAVTMAATAVGLLLSVHVSLFGYRESLAVPYATSSLVIEFTGAAVLLLAAIILAVAGRAGTETGP